MSKTKATILPGQETLAIETASRPIEPEPFHAVPYLNENGGVVRLEDLPDFDLDWQRPLNYLEFMGEIGIALAGDGPESPTCDKALDVHGADFAKATPHELVKGLYFNGAMASRPGGNIAVIGRAAPTLQAPGVRPTREGVAVTGEEFKMIARSPADLAKHAWATTERANAKRPPAERYDEETLRDTAGRSSAHALLSKRDELLTLDKRLKMDRRMLIAVNQLALPDSESITIGELDWYRQAAALAIHGAVEIASKQLGYGTTVRNGIHRAIVSRFYRSEPDTMAASLKNFTKWAGYYIDAKRGKVEQSLTLAGREFGHYKHFLATKTNQPAAAPAEATEAA